jgi:hypothetical protein
MHMARYPGLMLRKARWYLRCNVPVDLVEFLGRREIWRSLGTGDHSLAVRGYRRARADLDQWFDAQRLRRDARERINGDVPRLVTEWFRAAEHRASHDDFDPIGFLDFVARQPGPQLFAELYRDHRGYLTDALQRRVNRQIERAGAKGDRQSFTPCAITRPMPSDVRVQPEKSLTVCSGGRAGTCGTGTAAALGS